jgi:putative tryptophan/tyrosine transport system substrate-binding protein
VSTRREFITLLGAAAAWPVSTRAQQANMPVVGFLSSLSEAGSINLTAGFYGGLSESGFVAGKNVAIEYRWADGHYDRLPAMAAELARRPVNAFVTVGGEPAALAAKSASSAIPIVFMVGRDPVELKLVESYSRPGGNATGINLLNETMETKRLGILHELLPHARTVAVLFNPRFPPAEMQTRELEQAAQSLGMQTQQFRASTQSEIEAAFRSIGRADLRAVIVATDPFFVTHRTDLVALAARYRLPTLYGFRDLATSGGLASYGIDLGQVYRQLGLYTGRILKGTNPADLPVLQPIKFEFVLNLRTAKALDIDVPDRLLALADEVIE